MLAQQSYLRLHLEILLCYLLVLLEDLSRTFASVVRRERPQVGVQEAADIAQVFARSAATCDITLRRIYYRCRQSRNYSRIIIGILNVGSLGLNVLSL